MFINKGMIYSVNPNEDSKVNELVIMSLNDTTEVKKFFLETSGDIGECDFHISIGY